MMNLWAHQKETHPELTNKYKCDIERHGHVTYEAARRCRRRTRVDVWPSHRALRAPKTPPPVVVRRPKNVEECVKLLDSAYKGALRFGTRLKDTVVVTHGDMTFSIAKVPK